MVRAVVGANWGDEGKGKVVGEFAEDADLVIRATGGANAGHTIEFQNDANKKQKVVTHLMPSGIIFPQTKGIIGQGVVIDIPQLWKDIETLERAGIRDVRERLMISGKAHVVFPYHKDMDELHERIKKNPVGTTKRGIGPCYEDKDSRVGIRMYDLLLPVQCLKDRIDEAVYLKNQNFANNGMEDRVVVDTQKLAEEYAAYGQSFWRNITNVDLVVRSAVDNDKNIVIEGAQAFGLDKDWGDYPNCTSSNCVTDGALIGAHIPWNALDECIIVSKAYCSRVGNGPFPTELPAHVENNQVTQYKEPYEGDVIRELGHEYGSTTKRPRRTGWCDAVMLGTARYALGGTAQCINHLDTLGEIGNTLGYIKVCVSYQYQGERINYYPDDINLTGEIPTPNYEIFKGGWDLTGKERSYDELPYAAREFLNLVENISGAPISYIGVGPDNEDLIVVDD